MPGSPSACGRARGATAVLSLNRIAERSPLSSAFPCSHVQMASRRAHAHSLSGAAWWLVCRRICALADEAHKAGPRCVKDAHVSLLACPDGESQREVLYLRRIHKWRVAALRGPILKSKKVSQDLADYACVSVEKNRE